MGPFEIRVFVGTAGGTCPHPGAAEVHLARHPDGRPLERCTLCRGGRAVTAGYAAA
jgi:hypothetical protein